MSETESTRLWKKCSNCKKAIEWGSLYYVCSVSTCNRERTGLQFCSVSCWSGHVPIMRHREAWAVEETAPKAPSSLQADASGPSFPDSAAPPELSDTAVAPTAKKFLPSIAQPAVASQTPKSAAEEDEVLVVVSKLKNYIRLQSEMNTSADVVDWLSDKIRRLSDEAILRARQDGRKTVMARDFI